MADAGCRSTPHVHTHSLARAASRHPSIVRRAGIRTSGASGPHAPSAANACQDTDAPYRTLRHAGPGMPPKAASEPALPVSSGSGQVAPGTFARAAVVAAPAVGAGAALAYRTLVAASASGTPLGTAVSSAWPDVSQLSTLSYVPSLPFAAPVEGDTPQGLSLVPLPAASGADVPTAVPEPSSALVLVPVLLAFVLTRRALRPFYGGDRLRRSTSSGIAFDGLRHRLAWSSARS